MVKSSDKSFLKTIFGTTAILLPKKMCGSFTNKNIVVSLQAIFGKVLEWLKRHAWKACIRQKRITGSNPVLSAKFFIM